MATTARPGLAASLERLGTETAFSVLARAQALEREGRDIIHVFDPVTRQVKRSVNPPGTITLASPAWLPGDSVLIVRCNPSRRP